MRSYEAGDVELLNERIDLRRDLFWLQFELLNSGLVRDETHAVACLV